MKQITHWFKRLFSVDKYERDIKNYGSKKDWKEIENIERFLKVCEVRITDYSKCEEIRTTLGLRIRYGNKDFFFYERRNSELSTGAKQYDMEYDGSGMAVHKLVEKTDETKET